MPWPCVVEIDTSPYIASHETFIICHEAIRSLVLVKPAARQIADGTSALVQGIHGSSTIQVSPSQAHKAEAGTAPGSAPLPPHASQTPVAKESKSEHSMQMAMRSVPVTTQLPGAPFDEYPWGHKAYQVSSVVLRELTQLARKGTSDNLLCTCDKNCGNKCNKRGKKPNGKLAVCCGEAGRLCWGERVGICTWGVACCAAQEGRYEATLYIYDVNGCF